MTDSFLHSMTFSRAGEFVERCDCDECDNIPPSIRKFIEDRKRHRMKAGLMKRTQHKSLVSRFGGVSLHCMHMPNGAEPLVDFGTSHRIVWVKRLPNHTNHHNNSSGLKHSTSILQWIGKGIIGSSAEEKGRTYLDSWTEGSVFLVPNNGGKAIGWIHTIDDRKETTEGIVDGGNKSEDKVPIDKQVLERNGFAVLYVAKLPSNIIDHKENEPTSSKEESTSHWVSTMITCCKDALQSFQKKSPSDGPYFFEFSSPQSKLLKAIIREIEEAESVPEPPTKRICRKW